MLTFNSGHVASTAWFLWSNMKHQLCSRIWLHRLDSREPGRQLVRSCCLFSEQLLWFLCLSKAGLELCQWFDLPTNVSCLWIWLFCFNSFFHHPCVELFPEFPMVLENILPERKSLSMPLLDKLYCSGFSTSSDSRTCIAQNHPSNISLMITFHCNL